MKKLFTLVALLTLCIGAQAKVHEFMIDYTKLTELKFYGWGASTEARGGEVTNNDTGEVTVHPQRVFLDGENGLWYHSEEATDPGWAVQFHPFAFDGDVEGGVIYKLSMEIKASHGFGMNGGFVGQNGWGKIQVPESTDWQVLEFEYEGVDGGGNALLLQCGDFVGDYWIKWIKVTYDIPDPDVPEVWNEILVNGDAEGEYGDLACAWAKEFNRYQGDDGLPENEPYPCDIEDDGTGNKVFVVHAKQVNKDDFAEGGQYYAKPGNNDSNAHAWMNQFWIQSPHAWKSGEQVKISFRYKASKAVSADTQCHLEHPGEYKHWSAIGSINFTEDWQTFNQKWTIPSEAPGMWSIAFNLKEVDTDVDYYFDDLSWLEQEFEEGYFVAGANAQAGLPYNYANSIEMKLDKELGVYTAVVGTEADPVHEITVSTKRGTAKAFQANALGLDRAATNNTGDDIDEYDWIDYNPKAKAEIKLPGTGVWKIFVDKPLDEGGYQQMAFVMLSGNLDKRYDVIANPTEIIVKGVERDWLGTNDDGSQKEEGGVGEGQPWDNQFWIMANRPLKAGEETYLVFEYSGSVEAKTTTQCHKGAGDYLHWAAIGDVTFATDFQKFEQKFTVPESADGMQSIAFNMAEIKGACDYHIKNVIWVAGYNADDNTAGELLVDQTGDKNFWWKVGANNTPVQGDPAGITTVTFDTKVNGSIFNLAGQKVNKDYKGIVIMNGKKVIK